MTRWFASAVEKSMALVMAGVIIGALASWFFTWWMLGPRRRDE